MLFLLLWNIISFGDGSGYLMLLNSQPRNVCDPLHALYKRGMTAASEVFYGVLSDL